MTVIQLVALVCLPFVWMMLANGPSRGAMRRMRRNARRGGVPEDVAFDRWMGKNGRIPAATSSFEKPSTIPVATSGYRQPTKDDHAAFALVVSVVTEIQDALVRGETVGSETRRIKAERYPQWVEQHGSKVAGLAIEMLNRCSGASFAIPGALRRDALERR